VRYARQLNLIGKRGQEKLRRAKVIIFGLGGLGNFVSLELTLAGVGKVTLVDKDTISLSDLNRQFLYEEKDVGKKKVLVAARRLREINPDVVIEPIYGDLMKMKIDKLIKDCDLVVDCLDDWKTRWKLFEEVKKAKKPLVHGAVEGWRGQVAFLKGSIDKVKKVGLACTAVLSPPVGLVGSLQATICLRYLLGQLKKEFFMTMNLEKGEFKRLEF